MINIIILLMRSSWSGFIAFGTIVIPIRLYAASGDIHIPFHQVHKSDCGRVRYKKVCEKDGEELTPNDIAKAYIIADECIQFTDEEIEAYRPADSKTMHIEGFCSFDQIPIMALSKPYYLGTESPRKGGVGKSFQLLKKAMEKSGKVAIVRWVSRSNEHIGMIEPHYDAFLLIQLLYHEQIRSSEEIEIIKGEIGEDLIELGVKVVEKMTFNFDWTNYNETYTQQVRELIERKALGEEVEKPELKPAEIKALESELEKMLATTD